MPLRTAACPASAGTFSGPRGRAGRPPELTDQSSSGRQRAFVQSVPVFSGYEFPSELTVALDEISAQPYEGRSGSGGLLLASEANPHMEPVLEFVKPIRVSETRSMRKALEMADPQHHLLCDGEKVVGLARLCDTYEPILAIPARNLTVRVEQINQLP